VTRRRILICNYEFPPLGGGASTGSSFLARELARLGHRVEVVTAGYGRLPALARRGGLTIRRLPCLRKQRGESNPVEMMSFVAAAVPYLMLRGGPRPEVIVSFHSIPSGLAAFPASLVRGIPHVVLFRGGDVPGWLPGELERLHRATLWLNRLIVNRSAVALANSDGLRDLAQRAFPHKAVGVLYNGIDPQAFTPPPGGRAARTGPVAILFAGRLTTQKGVDTLLNSLAALRGNSREWRLDIAGTGPRLAEFGELARRLGIVDRVKFLGLVSRKEIAGAYRRADIFAFPSRYEGMPNVVLEAAACGLPVIGTRIPGTEQLVEHGVNGLLCEADDVAALCANLRELIEDGATRLKMGTEARRRVEADWTWARRAKELEQVIDGVLVKRPAVWR